MSEISPDAEVVRTASTDSAVEIAALELRSIVELSHELSVRSNIFEIAEVALFSLLGHFGCSRGAIWVIPEDLPAEPVLLRAAGFPAPVGRVLGTLWTRWMADSPGPTGSILVREVARVVASPATDLAERHEIELLAPISSNGRRSGLLALGRRVGEKAFSPRDREVLAATLHFVGARLTAAASIDRAEDHNRRLQDANQRLEELDGMKSEFLRNLNHELRTPLTIITAYLDSVLMLEDRDSTRRGHLEIVRGEAKKLEHLLVNLLDFGRLRDDVLEVQMSPGDVAGLLRRWALERRPGIAAGLHELVYCENGAVPVALFEPKRVLQIVDSLVANATKFTPPGTRICVSVRGLEEEDGAWVCVDVADDGPGIPEEKLAFLFEAFRQGDGSETRRHGGLGVGLAFARLLAQCMNGRLDVDTRVDRGTTFSLRLQPA